MRRRLGRRRLKRLVQRAREGAFPQLVGCALFDDAHDDAGQHFTDLAVVALAPWTAGPGVDLDVAYAELSVEREADEEGQLLEYLAHPRIDVRIHDDFASNSRERVSATGPTTRPTRPSTWKPPRQPMRIH